MDKNNARLRLAFVVALGLLIPAVAQARDRYVGDWKWNVDDPEMFVAAIENGPDHMLGQFCDPESTTCFYAVGFDIYCKPGEKYAVLINSDVGAAHLEFICGDRIGDQNLLVASDFDAMDGIVRSANKVGFAIPMQGDDFKAVRFSLRGSNEAIDAMREAVSVMSSYKPKPGTKPAVERF